MIYFLCIEIMIRSKSDNICNEVYGFMIQYNAECMLKTIEILFNEAIKVEEKDKAMLN